MAFGLRNANYNALKKLSLKRRLDALFDPPVGTALFQMLTPTQAASLFPKYWLEGHPDIGGFLKAIPSSVSAERQKQYEKQLENTATGAAAGENFDAGGYRREYQKNMNEQTASVDRGSAYNVPKFTAEQDAQWNKIMSGPASADDVASFSKLSAEQLKTMNLTKYKDETTGKEMIRYTPPEITEEQAKASLQKGGSANEQDIDWNKTAGLNSSEAARKASVIMKWSKEFGANDAAAAAIAGNLNVESIGFKSNVSGDSGASYGLFQLKDDRRTRYLKWASKNNEDPANPKNQVKYALTVEEDPTFQKRTGMTVKQFLSSDLNVKEKSYMWMNNWERPAESAKGGKNDIIRSQYAEKFLSIGAAGTKPEGPGGTYTKEQIDTEIKRLREQQPGLSKQEAIKIVSQQSSGLPGQEFAPGDQRLTVTGRAAQVGPGDPRLEKMLAQASSYLPKGYRVELYSGLRPGDPRFHGKGMAADIRIIDSSGKPLSNYQDATHFKMYETFAQHARKIQHENFPELEGKFRWGGYFSGGKGKYGALDLMHFDLGGDKVGMAGGSWEKGLTDSQKSIWGGNIDSRGMGSVKDFKLPSKKEESKFSQASIESEKQFKEEIYRSEKNPFGGKTALEAAAAQSGQKLSDVKFNEKPSADQRDVPGSLQSVTQPKGPENAQGPIKPKTEPVKQKTTPAEPVKASAQATPEPSKTTATTAPAAAPPVKSPSPAPASASTPPTASPSMMQDPKAKTLVPGKADGGPVAVNTEQIAAYPIDGLRSDNAVVVNAHQKPLFTMNTNEKVLMDPNNNRAQVIPENKKTDVGAGPQKDFTSGIREEFNSTINQIKKDFANLVPTQVEPPSRDYTQIKMIENGWLNAINQSSSDPLNVPSIRRVAYRAGGMETGDPSTGFHHSRGNNS